MDRYRTMLCYVMLRTWASLRTQRQARVENARAAVAKYKYKITRNAFIFAQGRRHFIEKKEKRTERNDGRTRR